PPPGGETGGAAVLAEGRARHGPLRSCLLREPRGPGPPRGRAGPRLPQARGSLPERERPGGASRRPLEPQPPTPSLHRRLLRALPGGADADGEGPGRLPRTGPRPDHRPLRGASPPGGALGGDLARRRVEGAGAFPPEGRHQPDAGEAEGVPARRPEAHRAADRALHEGPPGPDAGDAPRGPRVADGGDARGGSRAQDPEGRREART